ncbi:hypothetical protein NHQ30_006312 [Ciborinia camelliae]|nr:hypothetical protein NHQ30_006312 [Ciborinia camelliae]
MRDVSQRLRVDDLSRAGYPASETADKDRGPRKVFYEQKLQNLIAQSREQRFGALINPIRTAKCDCDADKEITTFNVPVNPELRMSGQQKKKIDFAQDCAKREVKVGYFLEHNCSYTFLRRMSENPDELSTIFCREELKSYLQEYEMKEKDRKFKPDPRLDKTLRDHGKEFFESFDDVIDTESIYNGSSEKRKKYGIECIAYLCHVEAMCKSPERKWKLWKACGRYLQFSDWKGIDLKVRDIPGLGKIRREMSVIRKRESFSSEGAGRGEGIDSERGDENSALRVQMDTTSTQHHAFQQNQAVWGENVAATNILDVSGNASINGGGEEYSVVRTQHHAAQQSQFNSSRKGPIATPAQSHHLHSIQTSNGQEDAVFRRIPRLTKLLTTKAALYLGHRNIQTSP